MSIYVDTSFLASLYIPDAHSKRAVGAIIDCPPLPLCPLHRAEWTHVTGQHVFRQLISVQDAQAVQRLFEQDRKDGFWKDVSMASNVFETCIRLARKYAAKLGTRTLDTLHIAMALELDAKSFWTFDDRQMRLAKAEGLQLLH